jgi:hypothetical protein
MEKGVSNREQFSKKVYRHYYNDYLSFINNTICDVKKLV